MTTEHTSNQQTGDHEATSRAGQSRWGAALQTLATEFRKLKDAAVCARVRKACRESFYGLFWELTCQRAKVDLGIRGFKGGADEDAMDAAAEATTILLTQEEARTGVFGHEFPDDDGAPQCQQHDG